MRFAGGGGTWTSFGCPIAPLQPAERCETVCPWRLAEAKAPARKVHRASCEEPPNAMPEDANVVLFAKFETVSGALVKKPHYLLVQGKQSICVNLRFM